MKKYLFIILAVPVMLTFFSIKVKAAIINKQYDRVYEAQDDSVKVTETKTINITQSSWYIPAGTEESFIIFNPFKGDPKQSNKLQKTLNSISIIDSYGIKLSYESQKTSGDNLQIIIRFPSNINYGNSYKVTLSYISYGLLIKSGAIRDFYIPAFSKDYVFESGNSKETVTTEAKIPTNFGEINFTAPEVGIKKSNNFWVVDYNQEQLVGETGWIQIGKTQYYSFDLKQPYTPSTTIPFPYNTYKIILPRNIKSGHINQKVYFTKLDPEPTTVYEDSDGNLIAEFRVPSNASGTIEVKGYGILDQNLKLNPNDSGNLSDVNKSEFQTDLANAKYWESAAIQIQQAANTIKGSETNVYNLVDKTYKFVVDKIDYDNVKRFGLNQRQGALATLQNGSGVCMEYSDLFIALMRAMGVPARGAFGHAYSAIDYLSTQDNTINHQWAEVYVPGINSWIPVDTTWGENGPAVIGGDLNHFYTHVASVDPNTPSSTEVSFYGSLDVPQREDDIEPADSAVTKTKNAMTEDDLIQKYPKNTSIWQVLSDATSSINLFTYSIDQRIDSLLFNIVPDNSLRSVVKTIIEAVPIAIILIFIILRVRKRKHKKNEVKDVKTKTKEKEEDNIKLKSPFG